MSGDFAFASMETRQHKRKVFDAITKEWLGIDEMVETVRLETIRLVHYIKRGKFWTDGNMSIDDTEAHWNHIDNYISYITSRISIGSYGSRYIDVLQQLRDDMNETIKKMKEKGKPIDAIMFADGDT